MTDSRGTVVVPAYNEQETVAASLMRIADTLLGSLPEWRWEIVVVDDGSADATAESVTAVAPSLRGMGLAVRLVRHQVNQGLGAALRTGFAVSTGDVVVVVDCDLSYAPSHIPVLVRALRRQRAQVAVASPYMTGGQALGVPAHIERRSRVANSFLAACSRSNISTFTGMVRAYDGPFIRAVSLKATDDAINVEILYKAAVLRGRIVEVPATLDWRGLEGRAGRTRSLDPRTRAKTYQMLLSGVLFRPYLLFLACAAIMIAVGLVLGLVAVLLPGSQVGMTLCGLSILIIGIGMCFASIISVQVKRSFEELYFQAFRDAAELRDAVAEMARKDIAASRPVAVTDDTPTTGVLQADDGARKGPMTGPDWSASVPDGHDLAPHTGVGSLR